MVHYSVEKIEIKLKITSIVNATDINGNTVSLQVYCYCILTEINP